MILLALLPLTVVAEPESKCFGTTANGRLEQGVQLPGDGPNFTSYSTLAGVLGRTYVHSKVKTILLDAYKQLESEAPDKVFKYGETGFENGGRFKPHKTHRNGLSVDFFVPVTNPKGQSAHLPTHPLNRWGYDLEMDNRHRFDDLTLDYPAMAAHLVALHKAAKKQGVDIWRVIFDPQLQPELFKTPHGPYLQKHLQFSTRRAWVRHDEHYHVDFSVPCQSG